MTPPGLVVVKVGGSLYDHPHLGPGLRRFLGELPADKVLVVAGGGPFADAVRELDRVHRLGESASHHLALRVLASAAGFLAHLVGETLRVRFLPAEQFLSEREQRGHPVPHTWAVTTDSIAALAAKVANARLILLKSLDIPPGTPWPEAAARGWVDDYFPSAVADAAFPIEAVNFRRWLDERFPDPPGER